MKQKAQILLLPTEKESNLYLFEKTNKLILSNHPNQKDEATSQHLYILSNKKIKEGDWGYDAFHGIFKVTDNALKSTKKIIATTDKTLNLPSPTQDFIEKYIKSYNEGNEITDVLVEYEKHYGSSNFEHDNYYAPKINQDNTITILQAKESWSREELYSIMQQYVDYYEFSGYITPQKFIEENLWKLKQKLWK